MMSNSCFHPDLSVGPIGTSAVVLALSVKCKTKFYAKGFNRVTGLMKDQSAYCRELTGVISTLTMLYMPLWNYKIPVGSVTITLDRESALTQSGDDWPLSVHQSSLIISILSMGGLGYLLSSSKFDMSRVTKQIILDKTSWIGGHVERRGQSSS